VRAFRLAQELGHHIDRMMRHCEDFAEAWALAMEERVWSSFEAWFGRWLRWSFKA
jgi:hypothetical protein